MNRPPLNLVLEKQSFTVCRLPAGDPMPSWTDACRDFISITRTPDELSIVCASGIVPPAVKQERGWRALKVAGPIDFALTGVLVSLLHPLARAGISIFSVSTFDTDYVLVKEDRVAEAVQVLRLAGHTIAVPPA